MGTRTRVGERGTLPRGGKTGAGTGAPALAFLSASSLHLSALLVQVFHVTSKDKVVVVELGQLAVLALEAFHFLG